MHPIDEFYRRKFVGLKQNILGDIKIYSETILHHLTLFWNVFILNDFSDGRERWSFQSASSVPSSNRGSIFQPNFAEIEFVKSCRGCQKTDKIGKKIFKFFSFCFKLFLLISLRYFISKIFFKSNFPLFVSLKTHLWQYAGIFLKKFFEQNFFSLFLIN